MRGLMLALVSASFTSGGFAAPAPVPMTPPAFKAQYSQSDTRALIANIASGTAAQELEYGVFARCRPGDAFGLTCLVDVNAALANTDRHAAAWIARRCRGSS
jgi:hypothetical protein